MKKIFLILVLFLSAIFTRTAIANEISLFDSSGRPVAYISTDDAMTIYSKRQKFLPIDVWH